MCQPKNLALKKEDSAKGADAQGKRPSQNKEGCTGAGEATKKRKLSSCCWKEAEARIMKEWQDEKENEKMVRKRVHSKAYHASFKLAKQCGHGAEEAKALARKAGADAARVWAENGKKCE